MFSSLIKRLIRHFQGVVVEKRKRNLQKSVMHEQSFVSLFEPNDFFDVHVAVSGSDLRTSLRGGGGPQVGEETRFGGVTRLSI